MKAKDTKLNDALMIEGLRYHIGSLITEHFVALELERFEILVRKRIKPFVEKVVVESINKDISDFGQKMAYEVHVKWLEDKEDKK